VQYTPTKKDEKWQIIPSNTMKNYKRKICQRT